MIEMIYKTMKFRVVTTIVFSQGRGTHLNKDVENKLNDNKDYVHMDC